jgi:hypothetical protein
MVACKTEPKINNEDPVPKKELADGNYPYGRLSTYGFFTGELNELSPIKDVVPYKPASSLFTDYALKSRFIFFPEGEKATLTSNEFDFPKGTILI